MRKPNIILLLLCFVLPLTSFGTMIIPTQHMGDYAQYSDLVGVYHFDYEEDRLENDRIYTYMVFSPVDTWKGDARSVEIRQMSYKTDVDEGFRMDVQIDLEPQKEYLLFLSEVNGRYFPGLCNYGIYNVEDFEGEKILIPTQSSINTHLSDRLDGKSVEPLQSYYYGEFKQAIQSYLISHQWNLDISEVDGVNIHDYHKAPVGCAYLGAGGGFVGVRWVNSNIDSYTDDDGDDDLPNVETCIDNALDAINNNYNVFLTSSGTTDYNPSCSSGSATDGYPSYANNNLSGAQTLLHIFNDPCGEIADLSGCSGTLAIGGCYYGGSNVFNGDTWYNGQHGYAIYNNGLGACFGCGDYEIVATHESTHALGMGHLSASSYPGNNMNPSCCNNINTKDIECMDHAYLASVPIELAFFKGELVKSSVVLSWRSLSELNCDNYNIEKSRNGRDGWQVIHEEECSMLSAGSIDYEFVDHEVYAGDNYYRLSQTDVDGTKTYFDIIRIAYSGEDEWTLSHDNGGLQLNSDSDRLVGSEVSVYNLSGQQLSSTTLQRGENNLGLEGSGNNMILILRIESETGMEVTKVFVP